MIDPSQLAPRRRRSLPEQVEESSNAPVEREEAFSPSLLLSTGSTLLDLACSDNPNGGFLLGRMVNLIGDSSSGKTLLCLSMLAEACNDSRFDDYKIIFDDVEAAMSFNISHLFGSKLANRIDSPVTNEEGESQGSDTIQQFGYHVMDAINSGEPFIYVLDSFDALSSDEEIGKMEAAQEAYEKGKDTKGSYGMEKAKIGGRILANIVRKLKNTKSMVLIISQTRENIDPMSFTKKTRAGGKALKFYATHEIWLAAGQKKKGKGGERVIGTEAKAKISKNKLTGKVREVSFNIFYDYGVDDIGSCVDFLVEEKHWGKTKNTIHATELELDGGRDTIIRGIEDKGLERKLKRIVSKVWNQIEEDLKLNRKGRYE